MKQLVRRRAACMASRRTVVILALVVVGMIACSADNEMQQPGTTTRDSAGVVIVDNTRATWQPGEEWRISVDPVLDIGIVDGPPEYQLFRARSAARSSDGRVVIANGGTNELRFYDHAGTHLYSVGRTGEGPGEFRDLQRVWLFGGDSLLAYDFAPARLSVFSPSGDYVRSVHIASPEGRQVIVRGSLNDGSLIAVGAPIWDAPGATSGIVRDSVPYYRYDSDGAFLGTLGRFPSVEVFRIITGDSWRLTGLPFPRAPVAAVARDRFYFGPADDYEFQTYTPTGQLERVVRLPHERRPVTSADRERFREERLERADREGTRPAMERMLAATPYPDVMPPYDRALVDEEGNLWLADYRPPGSDEDSSWKVFTPAGQFLGAVTVPGQFDVLQVGADFVLGYWLDELDVEHIRMYALSRQP